MLLITSSSILSAILVAMVLTFPKEMSMMYYCDSVCVCVRTTACVCVLDIHRVIESNKKFRASDSGRYFTPLHTSMGKTLTESCHMH